MMTYLRSWTITRWIYAALGSYLVVAAVIDQQWVAAFLGTYFAAMGIVGFGCAVRNCAPNPHPENLNQDVDQLQVEYKEVKIKNDGNNN